MATALDIINGSLSAIGALAPGEYLDPALATDALNMLNRFLDASSNDEFAVFYINETAYNVAGSTTWTIGPSGQIVAPRPLSIRSAFVRVAGIDYPVTVLNREQYNLIGLKQLNGPWPRAVYYQPTMPNGVLTFWSLPSTGEIHLFSLAALTDFSSITTAVNFPPGYEMWLLWELAKLLAPGYGKASMMQFLDAQAREFRSKIARTNMQPMQTVSFDPVIAMHGPDAGFIMHGGFGRP